MKIIYILILALFISACSSTQTQSSSVYVGSEEENANSTCSNTQAQSSPVYFASEERTIYLTVSRAFHELLGLFVVKKNNNFVLNVGLLCGEKVAEYKLLSTTALTDEQMSAIYALYDGIDVSKLRNLKNRPIADGSAWGFSVVENYKMIESFVVSNPSVGYETEESKKLFKLGQYLWGLAEIDSPLY